LNQTTFRDLTYYRIGGPVGSVHFPSSYAALQNLWKRLSEEGGQVALIGAGSNVLCSDEYFEGDVVSCRSMSGWQVLSSPESETMQILVEAGVTNTECAEIGLELGFIDLAWMYRMPGQLGATVRMNARCYGGEISQVVSHVFTVQPNGAMQTRIGRDVFVGYKDTSLMKSKEIVAAAVIELRRPAPRAEILAFMEQCEADRHRKNHFLLPSCGSTFKNNYAVGKPSGQIFDELGFKGMRVGDAQVSQFHGNFLFNCGNARAADVLELAGRMSASAADHGMSLELEVQPVGEFEASIAKDLRFFALDPDTVRLGSDKVMTGLTSYASQKIQGMQETQVKKGQESYPRILASVPFAGWNAEHGAGLGRVIMEVTQLRSLHTAATLAQPGSPLLRIAFCAADAAHLAALLATKPPRQGFQDQLWEASVFECFIFAEEPSENYLELEVHDDRSWLAIEFNGIRKRVHGPLPELQGIKPFSQSGEGRVQVGFDISLEALAPYLCAGNLLLKGAYAGWRSNAGVKVRRYATSPPRGRESFLEPAAPDFHSRLNLIQVSLFTGE
jgi:UDP-N-acetylmuramate dehydrogenase